MATPTSIAIRRTDALDRVTTAAERIADATGAQVAPFPAPHKVAELRPAIEAEWLADALESIALAVAPAEDAHAQLSAMTRAELNDYAATIGVTDPTDYPNKTELIAAIEAAREDQSEMSHDTTPSTTTTPAPQPAQDGGEFFDGRSDGDAPAQAEGEEGE